jgi:4-hydroxy-tetrahydrodipicolinate reductase
LSRAAAHGPLRVAVLGAGRMGRELIATLAVSNDPTLAAVWARDPGKLVAGAGLAERAVLASVALSDDLDRVLAAADVAIDFTLPAATPAVLEAVARTGKPLVCGVSGLDEALLRRMREVAASVPVFHDRNMSFGIAVLSELTERAAAVLGPEFEAEVHETHHVHKIDAPSGTALKLGEAIAAARGADFASVFRYDARGEARRRSPEDIVFVVRREGEVPGEHTVVFRSAAETVELAHRVKYRRVFAEGALRAATWLAGRAPGFYRMRDLASDVLTRR